MGEDKVVCLYHLTKPHFRYGNKPKGWGDCSKCVPNGKNNGKCKGYVPVRMKTVVVRRKEED